MQRKRFQRRPFKEERIRRDFLRRRRADYNARRRAASFTEELAEIDRMELLEECGRVCYLCGKFLSVPIRHTLRTVNLSLNTEQLKFVEENVLSLLETIVRNSSDEYESLYSDFEYYVLELSDSSEGTASASASG